MMTSGNYRVVWSRWIIKYEVLNRESGGWRSGWEHIFRASNAMLKSLDFIQKEICGHWRWWVQRGSDLVSYPIAYPNPGPALEPVEKAGRPRYSQTHSPAGTVSWDSCSGWGQNRQKRWLG